LPGNAGSHLMVLLKNKNLPRDVDSLRNSGQVPNLICHFLLYGSLPIT
jgi:hypothetical protein